MTSRSAIPGRSRGQTVGAEVMVGLRRLRRQLRPPGRLLALRRGMGSRLAPPSWSEARGGRPARICSWMPASMRARCRSVWATAARDHDLRRGCAALRDRCAPAVSNRSDLGVRPSSTVSTASRCSPCVRWTIGTGSRSARADGLRRCRPYDLATAAYGYYLGGGGQWRNSCRDLIVSLDLRYADKVPRDHLLPDEPGPTRAGQFYDISGGTVSLSYRF